MCRRTGLGVVEVALVDPPGGRVYTRVRVERAKRMPDRRSLDGAE
jgi:hypothetical protein